MMYQCKVEGVTFGGPETRASGPPKTLTLHKHLFHMADIESHLVFKSIAQQEVFCTLCFVRKTVPDLLSQPARPAPPN